MYGGDNQITLRGLLVKHRKLFFDDTFFPIFLIFSNGVVVNYSFSETRYFEETLSKKPDSWANIILSKIFDKVGSILTDVWSSFNSFLLFLCKCAIFKELRFEHNVNTFTQIVHKNNTSIQIVHKNIRIFFNFSLFNMICFLKDVPPHLQKMMFRNFSQKD